MTYALVLGAGMVGVGTALALQAEGKSVVLLDKTEPGSETSYGNAGAIQAEAMEPYGVPLDLLTLFNIMTRQDNAVFIHNNAVLQNMRPLLSYFLNSFPKRHKIISQGYAPMIRQVLDDHQNLIDAADVEHLVTHDGLRQIYRAPKAFASAARHARYMEQEYGVGIQLEDTAQLNEAEPGLNVDMAGAVHWTDTWNVRDPGGLVKAYAGLFVKRGGTIVTGDAMTLTKKAGGWGVQSEQGELTAENAVVALGPWASELLPKLGYRNPMFFKRGYHQHFSYKEGENFTSPKTALMDVANAAVIAPTNYGVRVCSGAEIARRGAAPYPRQLERAIKAADELFDLGEPVELEPWLGNRPCMPDMLPVVGRAPGTEGLWLNFGHGHQGFTLGPTTGRLLAEEMVGGIVPHAAISPAQRIKPL